MTEDEFWPRLEFRVSAEFRGMEEDALRFLWCDGFVPQDYALDGPVPAIRGRAWIGNRQEEWGFVLLLPPGEMDRSSFDWSCLLPAADVTGWLSADPLGRRLEIEPAAARPDNDENQTGLDVS